MSGGYLHKLARLYGVQTDYVDAMGVLRKAQTATLLAVLRALGAHLEGARDVDSAFRRRLAEIWQTPIRPVTVVWRNHDSAAVAIGAMAGDVCRRAPSVELRLRSIEQDARVRLALEFEDGGRWKSERRIGELDETRRRKIDGAEYTCRRVPLPEDLPEGYHRIVLRSGAVETSGMLIVAPLLAQSPEVLEERGWGVFMPLYSLWRRSSWGAGDLGDLSKLVDWTASRGGSVLAMLPMLATQWELADGPSPYEPTTRLFWNEIYLDVRLTAAESKSRRAKELLSQSQFRDELRALRSSRMVDFGRLWRLKRQVLDVLAKECFSSCRLGELEQYCRRQPEAKRLAEFRAVSQRQGRHWQDWPERLRRGDIRQGDYDHRDYRFFLFSQWQMEEQLSAVASGARSKGAMLLMDLPLGVRGDGFDAWSRRDLFVRGMEVGAPPDAFAREGQNWMFPPVHPLRQRQEGYVYFRQCLRRHLEYARVLRLDHVMGLHRLYWIPQGNSPADGVYVRYPRQELFAVLALESRHHGAAIVGENLGTVPRIVNDALRRHRVLSMYVLPFEALPARGRRSSPGLSDVKGDQLAALNTHDLPSFKAFWEGTDIDERLRLGMIDSALARRMRVSRRKACHAIQSHLRRLRLLKGGSSSTIQLFLACLAFIGQSDAALAMVNLPDLWGETSSPNLPNAPADYPNWRRRAWWSLEDFSRMPPVVRAMEQVNISRRQGRQKVPK